MPCKFPVITKGSHRISVQPGIKENGSSNTRINYPFYGTFDTTLNLEAEKEYKITPLVPYRSTTKMDYFEDFENGGYRLKPTSLNNSTSFTLTQDPSEVYEGKNSAKCVLNKDTVMEYVTTDEYPLPGNGVETFIEINYKSDADMMVGFYQHAGSQVERYPMVGLYASTEWKKSYIKITQEVGTQIIKYPGKTSYFSIFIKAENLDNTPKTVLIDNIKLVRF
ncbi:MAG: hypothetical protein HYZ42_09925 [Bacteroidetes bacterium]|nr:hypothetical protein [Bacteroidota bacterium]